jgi:membrane protein DedA with SNARE-associated domain
MSDPFQAFAQEYAVYGYPVLFLGVLLENAGIPVPGETAVLVAGFLASPAGGGHFHIVLVILLTVVAAVLGDNLGFWLGHRLARPRLQSGRRFLFLTPGALQLAEGYFGRYGLWTIFFARFIAGLRVVGALAAGTAGMPWPRFLLANACGALAWATTMSLLGYFFGQSWHLLHAWLGRGSLILLGCVIVLVGLPYLLRRLRHMPLGSFERLARAQIWQGLLVAILEVVCVAVLLLMAQGRHSTGLDRDIAAWLEARRTPHMDLLAKAAILPGTLPVDVVLVALVVGGLWKQGRSWRESAALLWALLASEAVGLLIVGLLRYRDVEPIRAQVWPFGFAGLVPLRAFSVLGMIANLVTRQNRVLGRWISVLAAVLILGTGFGVVWTREQMLTEVLLEYAAGGLVLFAGLWWLEGYGPGLVRGMGSPGRSSVLQGLHCNGASADPLESGMG